MYSFCCGWRRYKNGGGGIRQSSNGVRTGAESQTGTRLPLPGVKLGQSRPGHHRSHPRRQRTVLSHPFQTPQRLPRRLDRAAETVWDGGIFPIIGKHSTIFNNKITFLYHTSLLSDLIRSSTDSSSAIGFSSKQFLFVFS